MLLLWILGMIISIGLMIVGPLLYSYEKVNGGIMGTVLMLGIALLLISIIGLCGLKVLNPNEAYVFALFGTYYGTIKVPGFFWVNPFCTALNPHSTPGSACCDGKRLGTVCFCEYGK